MIEIGPNLLSLGLALIGLVLALGQTWMHTTASRGSGSGQQQTTNISSTAHAQQDQQPKV